jgi:hypothetical protein
MQENQQVKNINKTHCDYLIDYITKSHDYIDSMEAVCIAYLGKYELSPSGHVLYFPELFVRCKYGLQSTSPTRTVFKYETRLNIRPDIDLYECMMEFNIANALQRDCPEIMSKISKKNVEYKLFVDDKDGDLSIHHVIRVGAQLVFVLNEAYELVNLYYTSDFFKNYKNKPLQETKDAVLFFALCAYSDRMRSITQDVDIHNLTVEKMKQYITLVDMIEV